MKNSKSSHFIIVAILMLSLCEYSVKGAAQDFSSALSEITSSNEIKKIIDFDNLKALFQKRQMIIPSNPNIPTTMFVGPTGEGKSTTISYLLGLPMQKKAYKVLNGSDNPFAAQSKEVIDIAGDSFSNIPIIGHSLTACTFRHESFLLREYGLNLCDCPGFFDNRGIAEQCFISMEAKKVIGHSGGVNAIVFVISKYSLLGARSKIFYEVLQTLEYMFDNPCYHTNSIFFAFTKAEGWNKNQFGTIVHEYAEHLKKQIEKEDEEKKNGNNQKNKPKADLALPKDIKKDKAEMLYRFLKIMIQQHETHFFVVNPTKPEERVTILDKLVCATVLKKTDIKFIGSSDIYQRLKNFNKKVHQNISILDAAKKKCVQSMGYPKFVQIAAEKMIKEKRDLVEKLRKNGIGHTEEQLKTIMQQAEQARIRQQKLLDEKQVSCNKLARETAETEARLNCYNSTQEELVATYRMDNCNTSTVYKVLHQGKPFIRIGHPNSSHTKNVTTNNPNLGSYSAEYRFSSACGYNEVKIYSQRRQYFQSEIPQLQSKLSTLRTQLQASKREVDQTLQKGNAIVERYNKLIKEGRPKEEVEALAKVMENELLVKEETHKKRIKQYEEATKLMKLIQKEEENIEPLQELSLSIIMILSLNCL